uniref:Uncharacterized protein n=1 Tax=Anguilla anguilla TaxID=7936 RepID=A0A0E9PCV2_ANGAN
MSGTPPFSYLTAQYVQVNDLLLKCLKCVIKLDYSLLDIKDAFRLHTEKPLSTA